MPTSPSAWYRQGEFDLHARTWIDASGNGNLASLSNIGLSAASTSLATVLTSVSTSGHGTPVPVLALHGTASASISFGNVVASSFSMCSVTRYTGGSSGRVLNGIGRNF
eukprot:2431216-Prymnesium_polylepis.1